MTLPLISATLGAILLIVQQLLLLNVGVHRGKTGKGVGSTGDETLERKVRQHANLAENSAIFIVVLALCEILGAGSLVVTAFAIAFGLSRLSHLIAFSSLSGSHHLERGRFFASFRMLGAFGTVFSGAGLGGYVLYLLTQIEIASAIRPMILGAL